MLGPTAAFVQIGARTYTRISAQANYTQLTARQMHPHRGQPPLAKTHVFPCIDRPVVSTKPQEQSDFPTKFRPTDQMLR